MTKNMGQLAVLVIRSAKNLCLVFDSALQFNKQVGSIVIDSFIQLCSFRDAFFSSRLDYCNSLDLSIIKTSMSCLQLIQNAAVRLLALRRGS